MTTPTPDDSKDREEAQQQFWALVSVSQLPDATKEALTQAIESAERAAYNAGLDKALEAIGKYEPESGFGKRDGEYEKHCHRNEFRDELRNRIKELKDDPKQ